MSTRSTVAYGEHFHLYKECFDDDNIYLELSGKDIEWSGSNGSLMVQIPGVVWEVIRRYPALQLDLVDKTDEELLGKVTAYVNIRAEEVRKFEEKFPGKKSFMRLAGSLTYGTTEETVEKQIETGLANLKRERDRQQSLLQQLNALLAQQPK